MCSNELEKTHNIIWNLELQILRGPALMFSTQFPKHYPVVISDGTVSKAITWVLKSMKYYVGNDISNIKILKTYYNIRIWKFQQGVQASFMKFSNLLKAEICQQTQFSLRGIKFLRKRPEYPILFQIHLCANMAT